MIPVFSLAASVTFGLYTDSNGHPGTLLEDWSVPVPGFPAQLATLSSVANPAIDLAARYGFILTEPSPNAASWYQNNQGVDGGVGVGNNLAAFLNVVPGSPAPAIELNSTTPTTALVPEPPTELAIASGLFIIGFMRRKQRGHRSATGVRTV